MGQTIGDGAINKPPVQEHHNGNESSSFHHEIHHTSHKHLLKRAHTTHQHRPDSAKAHVPDLCIVDRSQQSLVADEDQNESKMIARRAVAGVHCPAEAPRQESLVADEDQNQSKLLSRMALNGQSSAFSGFESLNLDVRPQPGAGQGNAFSGFESLNLDVKPQPKR